MLMARQALVWASYSIGAIKHLCLMPDAFLFEQFLGVIFMGGYKDDQQANQAHTAALLYRMRPRTETREDMSWADGALEQKLVLNNRHPPNRGLQRAAYR